MVLAEVTATIYCYILGIGGEIILEFLHVKIVFI
jgi:hypothetical protein